MPESLKEKTVKGIGWSAAENFSKIGINFIVGIILARLLSPSDYGLIAMITIFMVISQAFIESGFRNALIRKPEVTEEDNATAFIFNIVVAFIFYVILFIVSPLIAKFYNRPILCSLLRVEALCLIIGSFNIVQRVQLTRALNFKLIGIINVSTNIISCIMAIFMAYNNFGVWSLVAMHITSATMQMIFLWISLPWRPRLKWSNDSFHYLFGFGSKLLASRLLNDIYGNIYPIIIGKLFSANSLGQYTRAYSFASLPSSNLTGVLQKVTFPVLSQMQENTERLALNYRRMLRLSAYIVFPLMIGMAAVARPMVITLITEKWEESILYLQIVCFAMMWYPIHAINLNLLQVKGRSDLFLRLEIIKKCLATVMIFLAVPFGIVGMCVGHIITSILSLIINTYYTGKLIHVGFIKQMKDLTPTIINSLIMGILAYLSTLLFTNYTIQLIIGILTGAIYYILSSWLLHFSEFQEALDIIKKR